jgi:NaMN:DMB phosphoribosyltransferase
MAALRRLNAPFFVVDAGNAITPKVPMFTAGRKPGRSITEPEAVADVEELFLQGVIIGQQLAGNNHTLILGESVIIGGWDLPCSFNWVSMVIHAAYCSV